MKSNDTVIRFVFEDFDIRGQLVRLNQSYQDVCSKHPYPPLIRDLLGETLLGVCLIAGLSKTSGQLTLQYRGEEPLPLLCGRYHSQGSIRGLAQYQIDRLTTQDELAEALKNGTLALIYQPEDRSGGYESIVAAQGHSMIDAVQHYFSQSEQVATKIISNTSAFSASALLLQCLPSQNKEQMRNWEHLLSLAMTVSPEELEEVDSTTLLYRLFHQENVRVFEPTPIEFTCQCSIEKMENAIITLGHLEALEILKGHRTIDVTCEFCNHCYGFDDDDIKRIFNIPK